MYQFIHYETYNAAEARNIINEGLRVVGFAPHVQNPQKPKIMYGSVDNLADKIDVLKNKTKRKITQKTRSGEVKTFDRSIRDTEDVCLFGVISWPREWAETNPRLYEISKKLAIDKLKKDYGNQLEAVILHDDEAHPHLHFWAVPNDLELSNVCPATAAEKALKLNNPTAKTRLKARVDALKKYQSDWHSEVFTAAGLARFGPRRQRLTRNEWKCDNEARAVNANTHLQATDMRKHLAGVTSSMLIQNLNHKKDIERMNLKAQAITQGLSSAQQIEVAKQLRSTQAIQNLLGF